MKKIIIFLIFTYCSIHDVSTRNDLLDLAFITDKITLRSPSDEKTTVSDIMSLDMVFHHDYKALSEIVIDSPNLKTNITFDKVTQTFIFTTNFYLSYGEVYRLGLPYELSASMTVSDGTIYETNFSIPIDIASVVFSADGVIFPELAGDEWDSTNKIVITPQIQGAGIESVAVKGGIVSSTYTVEADPENPYKAIAINLDDSAFTVPASNFWIILDITSTSGTVQTFRQSYTGSSPATVTVNSPSLTATTYADELELDIEINSPSYGLTSVKITGVGFDSILYEYDPDSEIRNIHFTDTIPLYYDNAYNYTDESAGYPLKVEMYIEPLETTETTNITIPIKRKSVDVSSTYRELARPQGNLWNDIKLTIPIDVTGAPLTEVKTTDNLSEYAPIKYFAVHSDNAYDTFEIYVSNLSETLRTDEDAYIWVDLWNIDGNKTNTTELTDILFEKPTNTGIVLELDGDWSVPENISSSHGSINFKGSINPGYTRISSPKEVFFKLEDGTILYRGGTLSGSTVSWDFYVTYDELKVTGSTVTIEVYLVFNDGSAQKINFMDNKNTVKIE